MKSPGRRASNEQSESFKAIIEMIESSEHTSLTIESLVKTISEICGDRCFSANHMKRKRKILDHFGESLIVGSMGGKNGIVSLRHSVFSIVEDLYANSVEFSKDTFL